MAILITANSISKSFGVRPLFDGLTFVVESGERIGLIGPNGAGKSTLLKILAGVSTQDSGDISTQRGLKVGFLEQTPSLPAHKTVEDAVKELADPHDGIALASELLSKLDLQRYASDPVEKLSGGWKKRVALARELVKEPDLLLLDEPTNHLDIESILWLEEFLARAPFATITVTHDRLFLQRIANRILEVDRRNPNGLLNVRGDYATYILRKAELLQSQQKQETVLQNKLRRETEWLRQGAKARTTKQQARIHAAGDLKEQVEELEYRNQSKSARLDFQGSDKKPKRLIEGKKIGKAYGDKTLFRDLDLFIGPGSRIGLLGNNGSGKSTLIRCLLGQEEVDTGTLLRTEHLKVAYFEQNRETLEPTRTLRNTLCPGMETVIYRGRPVHIHGYLDRFLFKKEQVDMPVGRLSGGEQSRVLLARLMLQEANLLVLDEPTNDLDVETLDVLEECLTEFDGAVLLVTHDRYFLDHVATEILAFPDLDDKPGKLISFAGLAQWEDYRKEKRARQKSPAAASTASQVPSKKTLKLSYNEVRELSLMEGKIHTAEAKLKEIQDQSQDPKSATNASLLTRLYTEMAETQSEIDRLYARWAELEKKT
jgi:ABC transport system ATP-binding/permease protein